MAIRRRLVIKVGTNVMTRDDGLLDDPVFQRLVDCVCAFKQQGFHVVLVSSGAMAAGRALCSPHAGTVENRQILSAVGQPALMERYLQAFRRHGYLCAQLLITKADFRSRSHYLTMRRCMEALLSDNVVPVVNENDVIALEEIMFTDNDELAGLVASMLDAERLIILTSVEGVYNGPPCDPSSRVISEILPGNRCWQKTVNAGASLFGRGGIRTKCAMASRLASTGIPVQIANGRSEDALAALLNGEPVGTLFPASRKQSPVKRWIAYSQGTEKGGVVLNTCAVERLLSPCPISLLPVGVVRVEGAFQKGDVVQILDPSGGVRALGKAEYDAERLRLVAGKQGGLPFVRYDYLVLLDT